jgi:outer membrane protein OmpA-like peptidoglycan-associated protein
MKKILLTIFCSISIALSSVAQTSPAEQRDADDEMQHELKTPAVGAKQRTYVTTYMHQVATDLIRDSLTRNVETMRHGEVVVVTVQTDDLFQPNDTTLTRNATNILSRFKRFLSTDNKFKLILAVHSDDTGSEEYLSDLTENRINAILDYYERENCSIDNIVGFPKGASEPLYDNNSRSNRAANRRLEVYIVPDTPLIEESTAKKK